MFVDMRLMDNTTEGHLFGRVEIRKEREGADEWGTICDDGFGLEESMVICRMLGFW